MIERIYLGYVVLSLLGFGLAFLFKPERTAGLVDVTAGSTTGWSDLRAVYGGLELGLAVFVGWCLYAGRFDVGLWLSAAIFTGIAVARAVGMIFDRPVTGRTVKILVVEAASAGVAWWLAL